jgi:hypothetical protein
MADTKKEKHRCPEIDKAVWNVKITGPAWNGESAAEARSAWFNYLRRLDAAVRPMSRKTY